MDLLCKCGLEINRVDEPYTTNPIYKDANKVCPACGEIMECVVPVDPELDVRV